MGKFILQQDIKIQGNVYRFAILEQPEKDGTWFYSVFAEIFEDETFTIIHCNRFDSENAAKEELKNLISLLMIVDGKSK